MAKLKMPAEAATALSMRETATEAVVKGLAERDTAGTLTLTDRGRAVLRAMLPDL
jgi:hypothetical protein